MPVRGSISVVIPTYRGAEFIGEMLRSLARQSVRPQQVIVVDDASPDATCDVVLEFARRSELPISLHVQSANSGGPAAPINAGLGHASGDYVSVVDQDDILHPRHLERLATPLDEDSSVVMSFGEVGQVGRGDQFRIVVGALETLASPDDDTPRPWRRVLGQSLLASVLSRGNILLGYPALMFRRRLLAARDGVDPQFKIGSDLDILAWMCLQGDVAHVRELVYWRRIHEAQLSSDMLRTAAESAAIMCRYVEMCPPVVRDPAFKTYFSRRFLWHLQHLADWRLAPMRLAVGTRARLAGIDLRGGDLFAVNDGARRHPSASRTATTPQQRTLAERLMRLVGALEAAGGL